jgi:hypothetical protein
LSTNSDRPFEVLQRDGHVDAKSDVGVKAASGVRWSFYEREFDYDRSHFDYGYNRYGGAVLGGVLGLVVLVLVVPWFAGVLSGTHGPTP